MPSAGRATGEPASPEYGIVNYARQLLVDVARVVEKQQAERGITRLPVVDFRAGRP